MHDPNPHGASPGRSLNLPVQARSPTRDNLNTQVYAQYLGLDQVMLNYLDMEGILELYALNHQTFETQEALSILTHRFNLTLNSPGVPVVPTTFRSLLKRYDSEYATVRSYNRISKALSYSDRSLEAENILYHAAHQGNIQAVINGFKLYPALVTEPILKEALEQAARGGHEAIIDLLLDLGAKNEYNEIIKGAIAGGHLDLIRGNKYETLNPLHKYVYRSLCRQAILYKQLASLKYLFSLPNYREYIPNSLIEYAGEMATPSIIDYLIKLGANDYNNLVLGAFNEQHFDIALKYLNQVNPGDVRLQFVAEYLVPILIQADRLDILKAIVSHNLLTELGLNQAYSYALKVGYPDIIKYLAGELV
jgi:hypothetical protein